ncbi:protein polybromo-1-like [Aphidius gifuensis]|nr:protein polybromo-1-like [Aphidius gifuensis]
MKKNIDEKNLKKIFASLQGYLEEKKISFFKLVDDNLNNSLIDINHLFNDDMDDNMVVRTSDTRHDTMVLYVANLSDLNSSVSIDNDEINKDEQSFVNDKRTYSIHEDSFDLEITTKHVTFDNTMLVYNYDEEENTSEGSTIPDEEIIQPYEDLFMAVMTATDPIDNNRPLHIVFQLKPSKKLYPEYYEVIETPIDLKTIARKIQDGSYNYLNEMERDLMLMCRNACDFNEPGSQIYKDAKLLKKIITTAAKKRNCESGAFTKSLNVAQSTRSKCGRSAQLLIAQTSTLSDEDEESDDEDYDTAENNNLQWQLFESIKTTPDDQGIRMSEFFWKLPSKKKYPNYYKTIKNPISLLQIRSNIKNGKYGTIDEVAGDMYNMFENAKKYNLHTSRLYKYAIELQKIMQEKVQELLENIK